MTQNKHWMGEPGRCDFCKVDLTTQKAFFDGKTTYGPWAMMCIACFRKYGVGIGTGVGQKYDGKPPYNKLEG